MTKSTKPKQGLGPRAAGRALGVAHSYLCRLAKEKRIPRNEDGTFDVEAVRARLARITDPAQVRAADPGRWSHAPRGANGETARPETIPADPKPDPAAYRSRADLPDDFARGALYGAHAVAYGMPHLAALAAAAAGADLAGQLAAHRAEREAAYVWVQDVTVALGLETEDASGPTALSPTAFMGYGPGGGTGAS